jgi:hypothetical protein
MKRLFVMHVGHPDRWDIDGDGGQEEPDYRSAYIITEDGPEDALGQYLKTVGPKALEGGITLIEIANVVGLNPSTLKVVK